VNGELLKFVHLEVLKLTFASVEQLQLLTLIHAPSLLSLDVSYATKTNLQQYSVPGDAVSTFLSTSRGIRDLRFGFPVDTITDLSLLELQSIKYTYTSHFFVFAGFEVPKLQDLFLEIDDGCGEDEDSVEDEDPAEDKGSAEDKDFVVDKDSAEDKDLVENPISIASAPPSFEVDGSPIVLGLDMESEAQKRNILEEDENRAEMNWPNDTRLYEVICDPIVASTPTFPAISFEYLKEFSFEVSTASKRRPIRALPYFPDMLATLPALERITLPAVHVSDSPYIDQLVQKVSEIPTLCPNLQEIRTRDYPSEWSNLLKLLRNRKRASLFPDPTLRPIHALHFPVTPHRSIVEELQDAMLGKVSTKSFPALFPWPCLSFSWEEVLKAYSDEQTRSQVQDGDEQTVVTHFQAQEEDATGNADKEREPREYSGCDVSKGESLPCFFCYKAGLGKGCCRVFWTWSMESMIAVMNDDIRCSRWDTVIRGESRFEAICLP